MKIKVGNKIYDGEEEPVMIILTDEEKQGVIEQIANNPGNKYCQYPDLPYWNDNNYKKIKKWIK